MIDILIVFGFIAISVLVVSVTMYFTLIKPTKNTIISKKIVYSCKQNNTNPTITELVEFSNILYGMSVLLYFCIIIF